MARDRYKYFRIEGQELIDHLSRDLLDLEKDPDPATLQRLLYRTHTLKGAARVVKHVQIGDLAHHVEDLLATGDKGELPERERIDQAIGAVDRMREAMSELVNPVDGPPAPHAATTAPVDDSYQSVRVSIPDMDELFHAAGEAGAVATRLRREMALIEQAVALADPGRSRAGESAMAQPDAGGEELARLLKQIRDNIVRHEAELSTELSSLQDLAAELRLVEAGVLTNELERTARETANAIGKQVAFQCTGVQTRIDAHVLAGLRGPLRHLVGNAIAHGIESSQERRDAGKPPQGVVKLTIERRGHRVAISCQDDGRGMDLNSLREASVRRGLASRKEAEQLDADSLLDLASRGGLSTAAEVSPVAGRGLGLDIARTTVEALKGELNIRTEPGLGTTVELVVPISLMSMPALAVEVDQATCLLPLDAVASTRQVSRQDLSSSSSGLTLLEGSEALSFLPLREALGGKPSDGPASGGRVAVLIRAGQQQAALGVDRLRGVRNVLVHPVPPSAQAHDIVAGAAVDAEGVPQLVLGPPALIRMAAMPRTAATPARLAEPPRVLIIDDSLTTRMMEQSILESAGYRADMAVSGEEALQQARRQDYALFLVDVEMPGMSGFEFIERSRADPALGNIPAILVSSRGSAEDKLRGKQVGARAYIVKSEFDQRELLDTIAQLVG